MALPAEHLEAAQRNADRAAASASDDAWLIVFRFYAVLHLVDGYLKTKGARFVAESHTARWAAIRSAPELRQATVAYRALQALSEQVRYNPCFKPTPADFTAAGQYADKIWAVVEPKLLRHIIDNP